MEFLPGTLLFILSNWMKQLAGAMKEKPTTSHRFLRNPQPGEALLSVTSRILTFALPVDAQEVRWDLGDILHTFADYGFISW